MKALAGIILADYQYPNHNPALLKSAQQYIKSRHWDFCVLLGDFLDMDALSHHAMESGDQRALEGKRLKKDYEAAARILIQLRRDLGKKCRMYFFLANHEEWAEKFIDKYPMLEGFLEVENNLPLKQLNIKILRYREHLRLGKLYFIHGDIHKGYTPANIAKKLVEIYNRNIIAGHNHTLQVHTRISPAGIDETHTGFSIPAMADTNPGWAKGMPSQWINGFCIFYITPDEFSVYPVVSAKNGTFISPEGKRYPL